MPGLNWDKERQRRIRRLATSQRSEDPQVVSGRTQARAEYLASVIEASKALKRQGKFFGFPDDLDRFERKLVISRTLTELARERKARRAH